MIAIAINPEILLMHFSNISINLKSLLPELQQFLTAVFDPRNHNKFFESVTKQRFQSIGSGLSVQRCKRQGREAALSAASLPWRFDLLGIMAAMPSRYIAVRFSQFFMEPINLLSVNIGILQKETVNRFRF